MKNYLLYLVSGHRGWLARQFIKICEIHGLRCVTFDGDLCDEELLSCGFVDEIVIVHFAGCKSNSDDLTLRNNIIATSQLVRLAMSVSCRHFILISSISAVGPTNNIVNSATVCNPSSYYGKSKLICEKIVSSYLDNYTIVRPTNIVDGNRVGVLAQIYQSMKDCRPYEVWTQSLKSKRDYISVNNVLEAIVNIAQNISLGIVQPMIINLGSGISYNMSDILKLIEDRIQTSLDTSIICNYSFASYDLLVDNTDTVRVLGKKPDSLREIINQCSWHI